MHIAVAVTFPGAGISGGRLHAWMLAAALAARGHRVTVVCEQTPTFLPLMPDVPGAQQIDYCKLKFNLLRGPAAFRPDLWIVVQERSLNARFFQPVFEQIERDGLPVLGLVFETPNWQAAMLPQFHHGMLESVLTELGRLRAHLLCSTQTGVRWAQAYWPELPPEHFHQIHPPVLAGLFPGEERREPDLLVSITRHRNPHKGFRLLCGLDQRALQGKRLVVLDSSAIGLESAYYLECMSARGGARVQVLQQVSEHEKIALLKRARALLFPSLFEGFGLPPAEAGYWGTPSVCCDLPVLRDVYGDELRYAAPSGEAFAQAVVDELAGPADFSPRPAARRIGDLDRWADEADALVRRIGGSGDPGVARLRRRDGPGHSPCAAVIVDQLQNWNRDDTRAALGDAVLEPVMVTFEEEIAERADQDCRARGYGGGDLMRLSGNVDEDLREKLRAALAEVRTNEVAIVEDLMVLPGELIPAAVEKLRSAGCAGVAFPVRYSHQAIGPHHYRTEAGHVLAACGVFRVDVLREVLDGARVPGCRQQPVLDLSYLLAHRGHRLLSADGWAERIPPRVRHLMWEVLPGGIGTWHAESGLDPLGPVPCAAPDDDVELALLADLRRRGLEFFGRAGQKVVSRAMIEGLDRDLSRASDYWRAHADRTRPLESVIQLRNNFPALCRCFFSRSVLLRYTDMWGLLASGGFDNPWRTDVVLVP